MKERTKALIQSRNGMSSNNYGCPVYVSLDACRALFAEAQVSPTPQAVGALGDIMENYALMLLKRSRGGAMCDKDLARIVDEIG